MTPPTHPGHQLDQVDSEIKNMGLSYIIRKKVINHQRLLVPQGLSMTPLPTQVDSEIKDMV